ncbi:hypothetical protein V5O48_014607 [Marasmius crinis-equi]|uniref:Uncharacterized protein n=1 Tax=Marasmius crinis-equi TaxID=585013 RepID=A0ABR3EWU3_9AGAR
MHHLIRSCRGEHKCLNSFALRMCTERPGSTLPAQYFEFLGTTDRALLTLAARVCPTICDSYLCSSVDKPAHYVNLEVEEGILHIVRRDWLKWMLKNRCGCKEILLEIPEDLSRCVLSGWELWCTLAERRDRLLKTPPSGYRSPLPDLPPLEELFKRVPKKRPTEEEPEDESTDDEQYPRYARRMRTGPCRDIVRKMEKKRAEKSGADENKVAGSDTE